MIGGTVYRPMGDTYTPHPYQERAISFMVANACGGLFLDPGLGKSSITLASFTLLKKMGMLKKMLIIAPLRVVYSVWPNEVAKWSEFNHLSVGILHGKAKDKVLAEEHDIYVTNFESLKWLENATKKDFPFQMLVIDESSKLKHCNTIRFKTMKKMLGKFSRRYILTGSPAANGLLDLYGQVYCFDQGATFGAYITKFRENYFFQSGYGGYEWKLKPLADQQIRDKLSPKVLSMSSKDYLDMPDLIKVNIPVTLPPEAQVQYLSMEKRLKSDFDDGKVTAANAAVAIMKCRQIASGSVYDEERNVVHVHSAKIEALEDLVEELAGNPLLVAYEFAHEAEAIKLALGDIPVIGGGMSATAGNLIIERWNRGEIPILLAQSSALAHGVNLQAGGHHICWYTVTYNLEVYEQFVARIWRQGQSERVFIYHLLATSTIDSTVLGIVDRKDKVQRSLLDALAEYIKK